MQIDGHAPIEAFSVEAGEMISDQPVRTAMPHCSRLWSVQ
jgi:hypothetical protein